MMSTEFQKNVGLVHILNCEYQLSRLQEHHLLPCASDAAGPYPYTASGGPVDGEGRPGSRFGGSIEQTAASSCQEKRGRESIGFKQLQG